MKKKKFLKFYSLKYLAKYLGVREESLIYIKENRDSFLSQSTKKTKNKERIFYNARGALKDILKKIDQKILSKVDFPNSFYGGIEGKSTKKNAEAHLKNSHILKIDIKNFYPSIRPTKVFAAFRKLKIGKDCSEFLSDITTIKNPPHLPQGFSTSPKIAALVLKNFDKRLHALAKKYNWKHTFWVDDITISSNFPIKKFKNLLIKLLLEEGFEVNPQKIEILTKKERISITGVVINKFPNIPKEKRNEIKSQIYYIKKFGIKNHLTKIKMPITKSNILKLKSKLAGEIRYIRSINKSLGEKFKKQFLLITWE